MTLLSLPGEGELVPWDNNVISRLVGFFLGVWETLRIASNLYDTINGGHYKALELVLPF